MIKAIIEAHYSKRDTYGNCYWFLRYTDTATGKTIEGTSTGGESNLYGIKREMGYKSEEAHFQCIQHPIREFNAITKKMPYIGCNPGAIAEKIKAQLKKP